MDFQQIGSLFIVALTAALLIRSGLRKQKRLWSGGCSGTCDCTTTTGQPKSLESPPPKRYLTYQRISGDLE